MRFRGWEFSSRKYLVDAGANIHAENKTLGTSLMEASSSGHLAAVQFLVKKGADVNIKNKYGATALMWALEQGHTNIVSILKDAGATE